MQRLVSLRKFGYCFPVPLYGAVVCIKANVSLVEGQSFQLLLLDEIAALSHLPHLYDLGLASDTSCCSLSEPSWRKDGLRPVKFRHLYNLLPLYTMADTNVRSRAPFVGGTSVLEIPTICCLCTQRRQDRPLLAAVTNIAAPYAQTRKPFRSLIHLPPCCAFTFASGEMKATAESGPAGAGQRHRSIRHSYPLT